MGTWIVGAIVFCIVGLAAYIVYKDHESGKGCGSCKSCSHCPDCPKPDSAKSP